jgi:hypothetical protein
MIVVTGEVLTDVVFRSTPLGACAHTPFVGIAPSDARRSSVGPRLPTFGSSRDRTWQADTMCRAVEMWQSWSKGNRRQ